MIPSESVTIDEVEYNPWDSIFETEPNLCDLIRVEQSLAQIDIEVSQASNLSIFIILCPRQHHYGKSINQC